MFEEANPPGLRNALGDWILRGGIALVFVLFGAGQWFRYFTGIGDPGPGSILGASPESLIRQPVTEPRA
jgi:hypothetical protein